MGRCAAMPRGPRLGARALGAGAMRFSLATMLLVATGAHGDEAPLPVPPPPAPCPVATVPHAVEAACPMASHGTECYYTCQPGYVAIGRHVCQSYTTVEGNTPISNAYFGGRCARLCENSDDCAYAAAIRFDSTDAHGQCLATRCMKDNQALLHLARGAYSLWNLGRNPTTGMHVGKVNPSADAMGQGDRAHIGINGVALMLVRMRADKPRLWHHSHTHASP